MLAELVAIAVGGALGASLRALLIVAVAAATAGARGEVIPGLRFGPGLATLCANVLGCLLFGLWTSGLVSAPESLPAVWGEPFMLSGLCGGLTTFSTLCAEAVLLGRERGTWAMTSYLLATLLIGASAFHVWLIRLLL